MSKKKNRKIVRYRKPLNLNVGMIIFAIIFLYLTFCVMAYLRRDKIQFYEVTEGGIVNNRSYNGLILREERVMTTDRAGHINFYLREGKRAAMGTRIYSLDETGELKKLLEDNTESDVAISRENLTSLKKQINNFVLSFSDQNFSSVYDSRYSLEASVMEYANYNALDQLDELAKESGAHFEQVTSDTSGVVSYSFDSYEGLTLNDIEESSFERTSYTKTINQSGGMIDSGAPAYKIVTSENWSIVFPMTEDDQWLEDRYQEQLQQGRGNGGVPVTVEFTSFSLDAPAQFSPFQGKDGNTYGKLDFTKYMEQFLSDRFVNFELRFDQTTGLKIPISAVTEKNFFLVPMDYVAAGGDSSDTGFYKETYSENGSPSILFVPAEIYSSDGEYYYIDAGENSDIKAGDYLVKPESTDRYQVSRTAPLKGVYNINKGYALFKQIEILDSNNEYYIVKKGMSYGLSVYDHIVLDASMVQDGQILYQ